MFFDSMCEAAKCTVYPMKDLPWFLWKLSCLMVQWISTFGTVLDLLRLKKSNESYIVLEEARVRDSLGPRGRELRVLKIGDEVHTTHALEEQGWACAVRLHDGNWVDTRGAGDCVPSLAKLIDPHDAARLISEPWLVCKDGLEIQQHASLKSAVVHTVNCGDPISFKRRVALWARQGATCPKTWIYRVQLQDGTWTTASVENYSHPLCVSEYVIPESVCPEGFAPKKKARIVKLRKEIAALQESYSAQVARYGLGQGLVGYLQLGLICLAEGRRKEELQRLKSGGTWPEYFVLDFLDIQDPLDELKSAWLQSNEWGARSSRCFVPSTLLWISDSDARRVEHLSANDSVLSALNCTPIRITRAIVHAESLCELVELRTREVRLVISADHRIPVPDLLWPGLAGAGCFFVGTHALNGATRNVLHSPSLSCTHTVFTTGRTALVAQLMCL